MDPVNGTGNDTWQGNETEGAVHTPTHLLTDYVQIALLSRPAPPLPSPIRRREGICEQA